MAIGNHLSSVIDFHVPEVLRDENPQFVKFLKSYYQFLESIQLCSTDVTGTFVEGTVLTGTTSKATGKRGTTFNDPSWNTLKSQSDITAVFFADL